MEVARMNSASGRACAGSVSAPGKRYTMKPRSHSDMEADVMDTNRKWEFPVGSKTPTLSRFGLKLSQKSSVSSSNIITPRQFKSSSRISGSVVHTPLPPTPPAVIPNTPTMIKSPLKSVQPKRKPSDSNHHLPPPPLHNHHHHEQNQHHHHHHHEQNQHPHHRFQRQSSVTTNLPVAFSSNFSRLIGLAPPGVPDGFFRPTNTFGKVKVILKITPQDAGQQSCLNVDPFKRHVTLVDLISGSLGSGTVSALQRPPHAPKMFLYDSVITEAEPQMNSCMTALPEAIHAVVGGLDGCVMSYGHARLGKTFTMVGSDESSSNPGLLPTAISWLFRLIGDRRKQTGMKYSIRVSAIEVAGRQEETIDLLAGDGGGHVTMKDDPISGIQLGNLCELMATTAEQACHYLDLSLARSYGVHRETRKNCHFMFIIHVYKSHIASTPNDDSSNCATHSRLYLIDFGSCSKSTREGSTLSLSALGLLILALLNGQRHIPYRESRLAQILKSVIGSSGCHSTVVVHVSGNPHLYNETLQMLQLTSRMNKLKIRKRSKAISSASSDDASNARAFKHRKGVKMGTLREANLLYSSGCEGGIYSSGSSEVSTDTTVFAGFESESRCSFSARSGPPSASGSCVTLDPVFESCYETLHQHQRFGGSTSGVSKLHHYDHHHHRRYHAINNRSAPSSTVSAPAYSHRRGPSDKSVSDETRYHRHPRRAYREPSFSPSKELWIDGPNANLPQQNPDNKINTSRSRPAGSNASISNAGGNNPTKGYGPPRERYEQWVDGPLEFQTLTRANVSVQKISYSKIVKVASLRDSNELLDEVNTKSFNQGVTMGHNLIGGILPLYQSTPNSTLTRKANKITELINTPLDPLKRMDSNSTELVCLQERLTNALPEGGRNESLEHDRNDSTSLSLKQFLSRDHNRDSRGQGDGKEVVATSFEVNESFQNQRHPLGHSGSIPNLGTIYSGITMCSTDDLNLSSMSSVENEDDEYDEEKKKKQTMPGTSIINRESIYELQMDEDLEFASGTESLRKLACLSDDEGNSLWTVSSVTSSPSKILKEGQSSKVATSAEETIQDFAAASSDLATVWMEQDFNVETFYVPAGMKPPQVQRSLPPMPLANLNHAGAQRFNQPMNQNIIFHQNNILKMDSRGNTPEFNNLLQDEIARKLKTKSNYNLISDKNPNHTPTPGSTSSIKSETNFHIKEVDRENHDELNIEMIQSTHSQISIGISKQAKISKVPKLQSPSPKKTQADSSTPRKILLSPSTHSPATHPSSLPPAHPLILPSTPLSPLSSKFSSSVSSSSIATTISDAIKTPDLPSTRSGTKEQPAKNKTSTKSGQSFLQKLRTPLFFRSKNSEKPEQKSITPMSPKEEKVGKFVSKVKLLTKDDKSSRLTNQKPNKEENKPTISNGIRSKLKPINVPKSPCVYETRLTPIEQSFHPISDGNRYSRPSLDKLDHEFKLSPPNQLGTFSSPSPILDHNYHNSVMQLMSPSCSRRLPNITETCSGNSKLKITCDGNSAPIESTSTFGSGSVFDEISKDVTKRFCMKERSQSEPYHSCESPVPSIPRDSMSSDLLNGFKVKKSLKVKGEKQNKMADNESGSCRLNEPKKCLTKSEICSLNDTFIGRSKTTNCFGVTCLSKNK